MRHQDNEKGIYVILVAILLVPLLFLIGFAIDSGKLELDRTRLQRASDSAAIVGASRVGNISSANVKTLAEKVAMDNMDLHNHYYDTANLSNYINVNLVNSTEVVVNTSTEEDTFFIGKALPGKSDWGLSTEASAVKRPVSVVLVVDVTGSMNTRSAGRRSPTRLELMKAAAKTFVSSFNESKDAFGLVAFNSSASVKYPLSYPFVKSGPGSIEEAIDGLTAGGSTNIQAGMKKGSEEMNRLPSVVPAPEAFLKVVVLITDGAPNTNSGGVYPSLCPSILNYKDMVYPVIEADLARDSGSFVFGIGIGADDPNSISPWQTQPTRSMPNATYLKRYMMRRLVNDQSQGPSDPAFPSTCFPDYSNIKGKPAGQYLESANPADITYMLNQVSLAIQMKLTK